MHRQKINRYPLKTCTTDLEPWRGMNPVVLQDQKIDQLVQPHHYFQPSVRFILKQNNTKQPEIFPTLVPYKSPKYDAWRGGKKNK